MKSRIIFFLNNDIYSKTALEFLLESLEYCEIKVITSLGVGNEKFLCEELLKMKEYEKIDISNNSNLIIYSYNNINSADALQNIKRFKPDFAISIRFGQIFKQELINIFPLGILNLHSGILPNYRGIMASFWAILNKEKTIGTTLHYITDPSIDTGNIIGFYKKDVNFDSTLFSNINSLYEGGCKLIIEAVKEIQKNKKIKTIDQKLLKEGQYFSYPKKCNVEEFLRIMPLF